MPWYTHKSTKYSCKFCLNFYIRIPYSRLRSKKKNNADPEGFPHCTSRNIKTLEVLKSLEHQNMSGKILSSSVIGCNNHKRITECANCTKRKITLHSKSPLKNAQRQCMSCTVYSISRIQYSYNVVANAIAFSTGTVIVTPLSIVNTVKIFYGDLPVGLFCQKILYCTGSNV